MTLPKCGSITSLGAIAICIINTAAWSPSSQGHRNFSSSQFRGRLLESPSFTLASAKMDTKQSSTLLSANKKDSDELSTELDQQEYVPFYGVSYIGGDPCGSKYNNDPFDATSESSKPGLPDSMKDRIAALAAKKLLEKKEKEKDS